MWSVECVGGEGISESVPWSIPHITVCSTYCSHHLSLVVYIATFAQVLQDHAKEFLDQMNSKEIAPQLKTLKLIPDVVESDIFQAKTKELANARLFNHLKEDADEKAVREVFRFASEKDGYGKMNTFAAGVLRKLQQGVYWCICTFTCCCCIQYMCLCNESLCNVTR